MEGMISPEFTAALKLQRERLNALFAQARREVPALRGDDFLHLLRNSVDPLIRDVAQIAPAAVTAVAEKLSMATLRLLQKGFIGPRDRYPDYERQLFRLLHGCLRLCTVDCGEVTRILANGLYNLTRTAGCRPNEWADLLEAAAGLCPDVRRLGATGQVAGWICGMVQNRDQALRLARELPADIVALLLGQTGDSSAVLAVLDRMASDPWYNPRRRQKPGLQVVAEAGGFRGVGGECLAPPQVIADAETIYVVDRGGSFILMADAFGSAFRRIHDSVPRKSTSGTYRLKKNGTVEGPTARSDIPWLAGCSSFAATSTTLAVTLPHSHRVFLISEVRG